MVLCTKTSRWYNLSLNSGTSLHNHTTKGPDRDSTVYVWGDITGRNCYATSSMQHWKAEMHTPELHVRHKAGTAAFVRRLGLPGLLLTLESKGDSIFGYFAFSLQQLVYLSFWIILLEWTNPCSSGGWLCLSLELSVPHTSKVHNVSMLVRLKQHYWIEVQAQLMVMSRFH